MIAATKYRTIVVDPAWPMKDWEKGRQRKSVERPRGAQFVNPLPYKTMSMKDIADLPVGLIADDRAHLYLWTTRRFLESAYRIVRGWGFAPGALLVWCKEPMGIGLGGTFTSNTEFILTGKRGALPYICRVDSSWWKWTRTPHSAKPDAFYDLVEQVSPGPYAELFARRARFGWDYPIGDESLGGVAA